MAADTVWYCLDNGCNPLNLADEVQRCHPCICACNEELLQGLQQQHSPFVTARAAGYPALCLPGDHC